MRAYIFDFNGTMVMDSYMHETAWRKYVEELCHREISEKEFRRHVHGKTSAMILEYFLGQEQGKGEETETTGVHLTKEEIAAYSEEKEVYYRQLCLENKDRFRLAEGLPEFLDRAKERGILMTIATAANLANVEFYFDYFDLGKWFDKSNVVYDDATLKGKPDPDIYIKAMANLGVAPSDCVVFEDAVSGVISASRAGAGMIVGIYGDSNRELLEETGSIQICIRNFREGLKYFFI